MSENKENNNWEINSQDILWELLNSEDTQKETLSEEKSSEIIEEKTEKKVEESLSTQDILSNVINEEIKNEQNQDDDKIIFDINIKWIDDLIDILLKNEFDFLVVEPYEDYVRISFKKDSILKLKKYIKFPTYSALLISLKKLSNLEIDKIDVEQKWTWKYEFNKKPLELITKTVPSNLWEHIFLKVKEAQVEKKEITKKKKNIDVKTAFSFLAWILFIALVVGWGFLSFIVFNAQTVEDVSFFYNLWINLNQINNFLLVSTTIVFSILVFILTVVWIIFLFKAIFTKKELKRKRLVSRIMSIFIFIVLFAAWTIWISVDKAIRALPNWQELSYWNIQLYDNDLLTSKNFDKWSALIKDYTNIIWPITIKFDLSYYDREEKRKWFTIKKYIWDFWWNDKVETLSPELIKDFKEKWTYNLSLVVEWTDRTWKQVSKEVSDTPKISVWYLVWVKETKLNNWWKTIEFDASDLKVLWDVEWYLENNFETPAYVWEFFRPSKIYFEKEMIWMQIKNKYQEWSEINKIFIISWEESNIEWDIEAVQSLDNDLEYTFSAKDLENSFWDWFINNFKWTLEWQEIEKKADITDLESSSKITFEFKNYWKQTIKLLLSNSSWNSKEITKEINIPKNINLNKQIQITNNWEIIEPKYDEKTREYFLYNIWVPTSLNFDATQVRSDNPLFTINEIKWSIIANNKKTEKTWNTIDYDVEIAWDIEIEVNYTLKHRKNSDDIVEKQEKIYIEWEKKEVALDLQIKAMSDYAPTIVKFDASLSQVKWENINKFIFDYWDWSSPEERDAKNEWRRYLKEWTYDIKLTVVTDTWKEYSITKKLVLKPRPTKAEITISLKKAPVWQEINFSSTKSQWQITWYLWDFGDWNKSTEANPSYAFSKPWKYTVKLTLDFANNNVLTDEVEVEITE